MLIVVGDADGIGADNLTLIGKCTSAIIAASGSCIIQSPKSFETKDPQGLFLFSCRLNKLNTLKDSIAYIISFEVLP